MTRHQDADDEWEDEDEDSGDGSDDEPTVPCPYCTREIFEDVPRCPYCEQYISDEDRVDRRKPMWVIATALICLGCVAWWLFTTFGSLFP
ncbi:MAG: hypothetical protein FJ275_09765 [Planctomycetes bacterium]|nr:hypothetical protein [Planctomycetota bacterium]